MFSVKQYAMLLLALVPLAAGQLINNGIGTLPTCGDSCAILTTAQSDCGTSWTCFCKNVWAASGEDTATMCDTSCTNPNDQANVAAWFNANCGSDNGASEHPATTSKTSSPTTTPSASSSSNSDTDDGSSSSGGCGGSWWHCHYGIIIGVIIIAIFLVVLGFGARWYKKRRDRKRDQNCATFNSGITAHSSYDEKAAEAAPFEAGSNGSESSARTREAFMPYGYGYTRSESRNDEPVITRGGTPFEEMEKGDAPYPSMPEPGMMNKMKRVMVKERSIK